MPLSHPARPLRTHQQQLLGIVQAIAAGSASDVHDILAAVTPGGGKSLLPVLAAHALIAAGAVARVVWVVPRDSLRLQAEEAFADPAWRAALGHALSVRAAENAPDPCRGLAGYVTTYQAVAAAPTLHLAEAQRHRTLLVLDEVHHLPALGEAAGGAAPEAEDEAAAWSRALLPLLECARVPLLLSGTLERADGRGILWLPYRKGPRAATREVDLAAPGWAVVGYSRAQALAERAVLPVTFGALDDDASWLQPTEDTAPAADGASPRQQVGPHRLSGSHPDETTRPALLTALRTGFADDLLRRAFDAIRDLRARRREARGCDPADDGRGLGKLLVVAPDQAQARRYCAVLRRWVPRQQVDTVRLAISDQPGAHEALAAFRLLAYPAVLVTVGIAAEGMDAPEVAVVAALTHIRSRSWLEQMVARATRVDPRAGSYESQQALVFHPNDPLFATFRRRIETEQGTLARKPRAGRQQAELPLWLREQLAGQERPGIVPLQSNALALRRPEQEAAQAELLEVPSAAERRLRARIGEMVAAQAVEDGERLSSGSPGGGAFAGSARAGLYHRYNAALKHALGGKGRAEMSLADLEAAVAWLGRNRLSDRLGLLAGDARYA